VQDQVRVYTSCMHKHGGIWSLVKQMKELPVVHGGVGWLEVAAEKRPCGGYLTVGNSRSPPAAHARLGSAACASCCLGRGWCELQLLVVEMVEEVTGVVVVLGWGQLWGEEGE